MWFNMLLYKPEEGALIEFKNGLTGYVGDIHPESNVVNLFWRYTGIAREMGYGKPLLGIICMGSKQL